MRIGCDERDPVCGRDCGLARDDASEASETADVWRNESPPSDDPLMHSGPVREFAREGELAVDPNVARLPAPVPRIYTKVLGPAEREERLQAKRYRPPRAPSSWSG
jgi:hypothetical protein